MAVSAEKGKYMPVPDSFRIEVDEWYEAEQKLIIDCANGDISVEEFLARLERRQEAEP